jgi:DNA topoisomerase-2
MKYQETSRPYKLSDLTNNEWREFALYTIAHRAIPNMYDSLKPVQRFYLYSSLISSMKEFKKVSSISGSLSNHGYNHAEASGASAGKLMAAKWYNNICLVEGRGAFGTRLIQSQGADRYVYTRVHPNFNKYVKDLDLSPTHSDPEHEPPAFYLPVIPLVLVNGTKGIATGFATNILPRSVKHIVAACEEYVKTGKINQSLPISFPEFSGTTVYDVEADRYVSEGIYTRPSKTRIVIEEVPYGFDREGYIKILDKLEDAGEIVGYDDLCDSNGFGFDVKLKNVNSSWKHEDIIKHFKLTKTHSENLNVIDENNKLRSYSDARDLVKDFCNFRNGILQKRIDLRIKELLEEVRWLTVKMQFIQAVIDNKIIFKNKKKQLVVDQIIAVTDAIDADCDRLLRINIMSLTDEMVKDLMAQQKTAGQSLLFWQATTVKAQFLSDLKEIK